MRTFIFSFFLSVFMANVNMFAAPLFPGRFAGPDVSKLTDDKAAATCVSCAGKGKTSKISINNEARATMEIPLAPEG